MEVACFNSIFLDVSGTEEGEGKENAPKGKLSLKGFFLGMHLRGA